jgi:shikimate kinase
MTEKHKQKRHIVLLGMMGAGKTTFGKKLATKLELPFYDSDHEIEYEIGHSISWIFDNAGETEFRKLESAMIEKLLSSDKPSVVALGGGAFLNEKNREVIFENSVSVWLRLSAETIFKRVSGRKGRPLLDSSEDLMLKIKTLLAEREDIYKLADKQVTVEHKHHQDILDELTQIAEENLPIFW